MNYLYFIIFLYLCANSAKRARRVLTYSSFGVKESFGVGRGASLLYYLIITSIFAFYIQGVIDLAAIRLLVTLCMLSLILALWGRGVRFTFGIAIYAMYIAWVCFGCMLSDGSIGYGIRAILKYLYPLLLLFVTSTFIEDGRFVMKISQDLCRMAHLSIFILFVPYADMLFQGLFYYGTAVSLHYVSISAIYLATYIFIDKRWCNLLLALLVILPCFIWGYRTSILANVAMLSVFALFMYKLRAVIILMLIVGLGLVSVFYIPSIKQKMFIQSENISIHELQDGGISMDMINSNGRFAMWRTLTRLFYKDHKVIGSGTGSVQEYMYEGSKFGGLKAAHNDYVTIICDNGLVGLVLYICAFASMILQCYIEFNRRNSNAIIKYCAIIAAGTTTAIMVSMYTENSLNYSIATWTCPMVFYGAMLGLKWNKSRVKYDFSRNTAI